MRITDPPSQQQNTNLIDLAGLQQESLNYSWRSHQLWGLTSKRIMNILSSKKEPVKRVLSKVSKMQENWQLAVIPASQVEGVRTALFLQKYLQTVSDTCANCSNRIIYHDEAVIQTQNNIEGCILP